MAKKTDDVRELYQTHHLDVLALNETWHEDVNCVAIKRLQTLGLNVIDAARPISSIPSKRDTISYVNHGEVTIVSQCCGVSIAKINVMLKVSTFEYLCFRVTSKGAFIILATIYRFGSVPPTAPFLKEFTAFVELLATFSTLLTIANDMNLHLHEVDDINTSGSMPFCRRLTWFSMWPYLLMTVVACSMWSSLGVGQSPTNMSVENVGLSNQRLISWSTKCHCRHQNTLPHRSGLGKTLIWTNLKRSC